MGSFGRKDVSQSRAGVYGKALSPRESLYYEVLFDDIPANISRGTSYRNIKILCHNKPVRGGKHNLQIDSVRSSHRRLVYSPPLPLFSAHSLLRFPKLVFYRDSFYRSTYFAINNCSSRDQISETRGHRGTCNEKYERAP
ncbi:unnamed protein product [Sphagnum jensenii]|uniref:Uncharacterized protein n=1 Tax=Sphagnum jensenii TaxID=128206 RepID=A0ABP0WF41_9BRYO